MKITPIVILACCLMTGIPAPAALADRLPAEPELDNREYVLDRVTNAYTREWRELWDGTDNALRFRLGSNNVEEWNLEEELKLAARLLTRLRLRFYHARLLNYSSRSFNTIEFEGELSTRYFFSVFATPTHDKVDNSFGVTLQRRTAVDRYALVYLEFPRFLNNFTEHHKDSADTLLTLYSRPPVKIGIDLWERMASHVTLRLAGYITNNFEMVNESERTGIRTDEETGRLWALSGWAEYCLDPARGIRRQTAAGISGAVRSSKKEKTGTPGSAQAFEKSVLPASRRTMGDLPFIDFDVAPFSVLAEDTAGAYNETAWFLQPYAWIAVTDMLVFRACLHLESRRLEWISPDGGRTAVENDYIVPALGLRIALGERQKSVIEGRLSASLRNREEEFRRLSGEYRITSDKFFDSRLAVAYEYHFRPDAVFRIIESIDLDREDWGQFSIHDHGFFQIIVGF